LAEVLITLAIIGIVAAITIPSIVANHQKRTLETQFAKGYRTLQQAVNLAVAEHGDLSTWDWKETYTTEEKNNFAKNYFIPYLNVAKYCPAEVAGTECFPDVKYARLNGTMADNLARKIYFPKVLLADGSSISFIVKGNCISDNNRCFEFYIDINGHKKPNTIGRDLFSFNIYPQTNEFLPHGINKENSYDENSGSFTKYTTEEVEADCSESGSGWPCAAKIIQEGFKINY